MIGYNVNNVINLKKLDMGCKKLQTIPSEIGQLINLQTLYLCIQSVANHSIRNRTTY